MSGAIELFCVVPGTCHVILVTRRLRVSHDNAVHFWAPTFKWGISIANIADFSKPPENISYPQQIAVTCTGLIWSRYSMVITPLLINQSLMDTAPRKQKNWNLFSVNVAMAGTGLAQLSRKITHHVHVDFQSWLNVDI
ncbi:Uncharacterised protein family UPF0041 [Prunus dulcis]|uniref:Mitochondrial pyruvate carrier n=1 Tax=Prunus dulcis TaxID=3755 RepID=A0A4Y1RDJ2_PRUDU|nr:Uncharacterised protein family UPF0041 [Prunus dulcis]